jgi:predicted DNA-binding transcriptional regulator YafY
MASLTYYIFRLALLEKKQVTCFYQGYRREICPHALGHTDGHEQAHAFQFAGQSAKELPSDGEWRCLKLDEVIDAEIRDGPWHTKTTHGNPQSCVKEVDVKLDY